MKINKIKLVGFTGIRSGLNRDELEINLKQVTDGASLIALSGPNGKGKTTLMDNLHPYRLMPSRASSYSPGAFSFYENLCLPECLKELEFEHQGATYKSSLVFKINGRRKAEAYLHVLNHTTQAWDPVKMPDGTVSDGKAETYDVCINALVGSPEMFFTSQFSAQNRRPLSSYANGEIKTLMADLLGLDKIRDTGGKAAQVVKLLKSGLDGMRGDLQRLSAREVEVQGMEAALAGASASVAQHQAAYDGVKPLLANAQSDLANAKAQQAASAGTETRRVALTDKLSSEKRKLAERLAAVSSDIARENARITRLLEEEKREVASFNQQVRGGQCQVSKLQALLNRKEEILASKAAAEKLRLEDSALAQQMESISKDVDAWQSLNSQKSVLTAQLEGIKRDGVTSKENCAGLQNRASLAAVVPCSGTDLQPRCPLMKEALEAKRQVVVVEAKTAAFRVSYKDALGRLNVLTEQIAALGDPAAARKEIEAKAREINAQLRQAEQVAALSQSLDDAEASLKVFQAQRSNLERDHEMKISSLRKEVEEAEKAVVSMKARLSENKQQGEKDVVAIQSEIAQLPAAFDSSMVASAEIALRDTEAHMSEAENNLRYAQKRVAECDATLSAAKSEIVAGESARAKAKKIEDELAYWTMLSKAFGNDGIVALSIDDAGPTLAALANDLLLSCYGPRFTVSIQTQVEQANGAVKEGFDIVVFDAERNDSKSVTVMSGGERVWINECLTRAIALYLAQSSGSQCKTLFSDEADGPLDAARKRMFIQMKRKVLELGGYEQEFFVSQTPDLWLMADKVVDLTLL